MTRQVRRGAFARVRLHGERSQDTFFLGFPLRGRVCCSCCCKTSCLSVVDACLRGLVRLVVLRMLCRDFSICNVCSHAFRVGSCVLFCLFWRVYLVLRPPCLLCQVFPNDAYVKPKNPRKISASITPGMLRTRHLTFEGIPIQKRVSRSFPLLVVHFVVRLVHCCRPCSSSHISRASYCVQ